MKSAQAANSLADHAPVSLLVPHLGTVAGRFLLAEGERLTSIYYKPRESPRLVSPDVAEEIGAACDKRCGELIGGNYGETACGVDERGNITGYPQVTVTDTHACTRPCVEKHEALHAVHMYPLCSELQACLKNAGQDDDAYEKCYDSFVRRLATTLPGTECAAYRNELECMRGQQSRPECTSKNGKARLASRRRGVECYRDCYCTGVATGSVPKPKR